MNMNILLLFGCCCCLVTTSVVGKTHRQHNKIRQLENIKQKAIRIHDEVGPVYGTEAFKEQTQVLKANTEAPLQQVQIEKPHISKADKVAQNNLKNSQRINSKRTQLPTDNTINALNNNNLNNNNKRNKNRKRNKPLKRRNQQQNFGNRRNQNRPPQRIIIPANLLDNNANNANNANNNNNNNNSNNNASNGPFADMFERMRRQFNQVTAFFALPPAQPIVSSPTNANTGRQPRLRI